MTQEQSEILEQIDRHLDSANLNWLLGAGISKDANIPLMNVLTRFVLEQIRESKNFSIVKDISSELPDGHHIEHILSHVGDYATIANRAGDCSVSIGSKKVPLNDLIQIHDDITREISKIIKWGHKESEGKINVGSSKNSFIDIKNHSNFIRALLKTSRAGLQERRCPSWLFTTNYDTLIEDALALCRVTYWDGFSGGAVAFRSHRFGDDIVYGKERACVVKLHGSVDWFMGEADDVWRVRENDPYPEKGARVLIYPQATKYVATQRDPFAAQFDLFRKIFSGQHDNVLAICGYSFGDEHINQEIELGMSSHSCKTTILAMCYEIEALPQAIVKWQQTPWAKRLYVLSQKGVYFASSGPYAFAEEGEEHSWWSFSGAIELLLNGPQRCI